MGQNQVPNIHISEYSMFLKPELDQLGFAQKWAKCLKRMHLIQDSTVIQLHGEMVIKPCQTDHK